MTDALTAQPDPNDFTEAPTVANFTSDLTVQPGDAIMEIPTAQRDHGDLTKASTNGQYNRRTNHQRC